jgi:hypothetical protein
MIPQSLADERFIIIRKIYDALLGCHQQGNSPQ